MTNTRETPLEHTEACYMQSGPGADCICDMESRQAAEISRLQSALTAQAQEIAELREKVERLEKDDLRAFQIECHMNRDISHALAEAANRLPACPLNALVCGALQEIEALRDAAQGAKP